MCPLNKSMLFLIYLWKYVNTTAHTCEPVNQIINGTEIVWGSQPLQNNKYESEPLCLNENFQSVLRHCVNNNWASEPNCSIIQGNINPCPDDLSYLEATQICYTVLCNQTFPPQCPYVNAMSFFDSSFLMDAKLVEGPVWFPARRSTDYGVGNMVVFEPSRYYGNIVNIANFSKGSFNKHCVIYHSKLQLEPVYCNSTYNSICAYAPLRNATNSYCTQYIHDQCTVSSFDFTSSKCFCLERLQNINLSYGHGELAELKDNHQNFLKMGSDTKCWIGLERKDDGQFHWSTSLEDIKYAHWSKDTNFSKKWGALKSDSSWSLEDSDTLSCGVYEKSIKLQKTELNLRLQRARKQLVLTVHYPQNLFVAEGTEYPVFCFSDTTTSLQAQKFSPQRFTESVIISENMTRYYFKYSVNCPGYYWCQAFEYPNLTLIKSEKVLVIDKDLFGNEFATTFIIKYREHENPTNLVFFNRMNIDINQQITLLKGVAPFYLRWITTLNVNEDELTAEYLMHVTSRDFNDIELEFELFKEQLGNAIVNVPTVIGMTEFFSVQFCMSSTSTSGGVELHWPLTKLNATVTPLEFCLQEDGWPVTRSCLGDFSNGAQWSSVNGTCSENPFVSSATSNLYHLLRSNKTFDEIAENLTVLTTNATDFIPVDIHFIAEIFENTEKRNVTHLQNIATIIDNLLKMPKSTLKYSQDILNSTDKILYNFDAVVKKLFIDGNIRPKIYTEIVTSNFIIVVFDAIQSGISGVALINKNGTTKLEIIQKEVSLGDLLEYEDLLVATYIPEPLIIQINSSLIAQQHLMVAITIFLNDCLFNDNAGNAWAPNHNIIGILLPTIIEEYDSAIPIIYKSSRKDVEKQCSYWHYGSAYDCENIKGYWKNEGGPIEDNETNISVCHFSHTTHFALLVLGDLSVTEQEELVRNYETLNVITTVECSLSIFGMTMILLTFALFRPWRQNKGNQMLVQFGIVTILQILLLYISTNINDRQENENVCIIVGAALHYVVLSQFCWMLVMAILHYKRFVLVFVKPPKWILLKSCVIGYIFPAFPVVIQLSVFKDNYAVGSIGMCYPTGEGLYFGIVIPGGCIILANLLMFLIIIWNVFYKKADNGLVHDYIFALKLRLVFVLFFMLGITWVFGFAAEIFGSIIFMYLFCITSSIQGFVTFLAFVVFNENTRNMYVYYIKSLRHKLKK